MNDVEKACVLYTWHVCEEVATLQEAGYDGGEMWACSMGSLILWSCPSPDEYMDTGVDIFPKSLSSKDEKQWGSQNEED